MFNARISLIATGLAFGLWEAIDIFRIDVPVVAAVFAMVFLGCTTWFWRRGSARAAAVLLLFFAFETAVAPTLHQVETITKVGVGGLGIAGIAAALAVLVALRRAKTSPGRGLAEAG